MLFHILVHLYGAAIITVYCRFPGLEIKPQWCLCLWNVSSINFMSLLRRVDPRPYVPSKTTHTGPNKIISHPLLCIVNVLKPFHWIDSFCKLNILFPRFSEALKLYRNRLSAFEQSEILDYPEIWFLGLEAKKIEAIQGASQNNSYDDENGSYIKVF